MPKSFLLIMTTATTALLLAACQGPEPAGTGAQGSLLFAPTHAGDQPRGTTPPQGALGQLDFFDKLEAKPFANWDDILTGILLAANQVPGVSYPDRLAQAKEFDLVGPEAPPLGIAPATPASFARALLIARGERFPPNPTPEQLLATAQQRGLLPPSLTIDSRLTGPVVIGALVAVGKPTNARAAADGPIVPVPSRPPAPTPPAFIPAGTTSAPGAKGAPKNPFAEFEDTQPATLTPNPTPSPKRVPAPSQWVAPGKGPVKPGPAIVPIDPNMPRPRPEPVPELPPG